MFAFLPPQSLYSSLVWSDSSGIFLVSGTDMELIRFQLNNCVEGIGALLEFMRWPAAAWIALAIALRMPNHRLQQFLEVLFFMLFYFSTTMVLSVLVSAYFDNESGFLMIQMLILAGTLALSWMALRRIERFIGEYWLDASGERDERDNERRSVWRRYRRI